MSMCLLKKDHSKEIAAYSSKRYFEVTDNKWEHVDKKVISTIKETTQAKLDSILG
jgi:hypothetical protein